VTEPSGDLCVAVRARDLRVLLRGAMRRGGWLPPGSWRGLRVEVTPKATVVTITSIDIGTMARGTPWAVRVVAERLPRMDVPIAITARRIGLHAIGFTWHLQGIVLPVAQLLLRLVPMARATAAIGPALTDLTASGGTLHLNHLPDPLPAICRMWALRTCDIPGAHGHALVLRAHPSPRRES
jgi:hypothetical protein